MDNPTDPVAQVEQITPSTPEQIQVVQGEAPQTPQPEVVIEQPAPEAPVVEPQAPDNPPVDPYESFTDADFRQAYEELCAKMGREFDATYPLYVENGIVHTDKFRTVLIVVKKA